MAKEEKTTTATQEDHVPASINVPSPKAFLSTTESKLMTTMEVMEHINSLLRPVLREYVGCSIMMNNAIMGGPIEPSMVRSLTPEGFMLDVPAQALYVNLYFRPNASEDSGIVNLVDVAERARQKSTEKKKAADNGDYKTLDLGRIDTVFGGKSVQAHYDLTDDTKEALSEFVFFPKNAHWERHVHETYEAVPYGTSIASVRVSGLSLERILAKIYGTKDVDGNQYQYAVAVSNLINDRASGVNGFLLSITRADADQIRELGIRLGMLGKVSAQGYVPCR